VRLPCSSLTQKQIPRSYRVEPRPLILSRGILALILCGILIGWGFTDIVIGGVREAAVMTVKSVYVQAINPFQNSRVPAPMWSIQVVRLWDVPCRWILFLMSEPQEIFDAALQPRVVLGHAVNVTPLWDVERLSHHYNVSTINLPPCQYVSEKTAITFDLVRVATFFCPDSSGRSDRTSMSRLQCVRVLVNSVY
jgi:hypothetical protein